VFDCSEQQDLAVLEQGSVFGYSEHRIWLYLDRVQCLAVVNTGSGFIGTGFSVWL